MQKSTLENFIKRYSLGGQCEKAHWYSNAEKELLIVRAHTETKTVILKVTMKGWKGVETFAVAFPSSTTVKSMLNPLGEEVSITVNKIRDYVASLTISDNDCESICTAALYDAFPETLDPDEADIPTNFEVEIQLTQEFIERFLKSVAALSGAKDFVLMNNKKKTLDAIINYEDTNTNRIRLPLTTVSGKDQIDTSLAFSTPILKAIINANSESQDAILKVTGRGMAMVEYKDDVFESKYLLFPTRMID